MTGKTAVEAWHQMYHELKNATELRDAAYEKVITELREELFNRTADLETAQARDVVTPEYLQSWIDRAYDAEAQLEAVRCLLESWNNTLWSAPSYSDPHELGVQLRKELLNALEQKEQS